VLARLAIANRQHTTRTGVRTQLATLKKLDECNAFFANGLHGGTPVRKKPLEGGMSQKKSR
jgi:hypothetical protein